jgi:predicted nucleic acid-binding protein
MILVDTSVWIDHFRRTEPALLELLQQERVLVHPAVIGELALGRLRDPERVLADLLELPAAATAGDDETLLFIRRNGLGGSGIGYTDAHLLASTRLTAGAALWTRDRRLIAAARRLDLCAPMEAYGGLQET